MRDSKTLSLVLHLYGLKTFPATLNSLSTGADETARHKYFLANPTRQGKSFSYFVQLSSGFGFGSCIDSSKFVCTSGRAGVGVAFCFGCAYLLKAKPSVLQCLSGGGIISSVFF